MRGRQVSSSRRSSIADRPSRSSAVNWKIWSPGPDSLPMALGGTIAEKEWPAGTRLGHAGAIEFLFEWGQTGVLGGNPIVAAGHRVGHGGLKYMRPVLITDQVITDLEQLVPLVPLHQPHNLAAIRVVTQRAPQLPQVACFDTAFHRTQPTVAQQIALPREFASEGVIRYGFHGLSYEYIASVLPEIDPHAARGRTIVAHLGNGASMCALSRGRSIATTMGFSALDGLPMGTRCGSLDPGVLLYLVGRHHLDVHQLEELLYKKSGLLGVSGISSDMRHYSKAAIRTPLKLSTCSSIVSAANSVPSRQPSAGSRRSCSPVASAKTRRIFASVSALTRLARHQARRTGELRPVPASLATKAVSPRG